MGTHIANHPKYVLFGGLLAVASFEWLRPSGIVGTILLMC
jgi:hypothetical protein